MIAIIKRPEDLTEWEKELLLLNLADPERGLEVARNNYIYSDDSWVPEIDSIIFRETRKESQQLRKDLAT